MSAVTARYGLPGHYHEWVVMIEGFNHGNYIPRSISDDLQIYLPTTAVMNRGNRIEIMTDDASSDLEHRILQIVAQTFLARPWLEEQRQQSSKTVTHEDWR